MPMAPLLPGGGISRGAGRRTAACCPAQMLGSPRVCRGWRAASSRLRPRRRTATPNVSLRGRTRVSLGRTMQRGSACGTDDERGREVDMLAGPTGSVEQPEQEPGRDAPGLGEWLRDGCQAQGLGEVRALSRLSPSRRGGRAAAASVRGLPCHPGPGTGSPRRESCHLPQPRRRPRASALAFPTGDVVSEGGIGVELRAGTFRLPRNGILRGLRR